MISAVVIVALALAQGLQAGDLPSVITLPLVIDGEPVLIQTLPAFIEPEIEAHPMPSPEDEVVVANPCSACFDYMTALIDQLTDVAVPEIEAHPMPQLEVPEVEEESDFQILPHPMPTVDVITPEEEGDFQIFPHPMPTVEVIGA